jgi:hypothetical protein
MSSPRLPDETREQYKARLLQESNDLDEIRNGKYVVVSDGVNRSMVRSIPVGDAVVLAKIAELSDGILPEKALQLLYLTTITCKRKKIIDTFKMEIAEYDRVDVLDEEIE